MKIAKLFKKNTSKSKKVTTETLDKKQLEKVIGGAGSVTETAGDRKSGSVILHDYNG